MNALRKALFILGVAAVLLGVSMGAAAEDDDVRAHECIALAACGAAISPVRGGVDSRSQLPNTVVVVARSVYPAERVSNFVFHDGRSTLRFLCLLLC